MTERATAPIVHVLAAVILLIISSSSLAQSFVNWETPQVHPIDLTPSGNTLLAVNTADNRLMIFDTSGGTPTLSAVVPVGLDPVSVRARSETEAWVVNHVSDSISVVGIPTARVIRTILTGDEPCDVVFAGAPQRAYVSISQLNQVRIIDPANPGAAPTIVAIQGEDPRALAVTADGSHVYVAIFESGNTTSAVRQQDVSNPAGPYGGQNPPPNAGSVFNPPLSPGLPPPPPVAQIVRRNAVGQWMDGNGRNWSQFVTWNLHDHDVAIIDTATQGVTYASGLMTNIMAIAVKPNGDVTVVGTEALNQIRFESVIRGTFLRIDMGSFNPSTPATTQVVDLNPHLTYTAPAIPALQRIQSIGDPRGIAWNAAGDRAFVTGMGSNNVIVADAAGARIARIDVGQGPTGIVMNADTTVAYVLNRFDGSISVIDTAANLETARVPFFDPTPQTIKLGRPLLYNTHATSGLGHIACGSCHIDGRTDFLAWDLGDPSGQMKTFNQTCRTPVCRNWHPMKGPMVTQSLQSIVGVEPFHWRGDREDVAAFSVAFPGLQGADAEPSPTQMQQMNDFLATIRYPSNPNRNIDGTMPASFPVSGGFTGNPNNGLNLYQTLPVLGGNTTCNSCHVLPVGTTRQIDDPNLPLAPQGLKIAQLRSLWEKDGWRRNSQTNSKGFGFNHHSEFDTLFALLNAGFAFPPPPTGIQQRRDIEAFLLCFNTDTHPAIGLQITFDGTNNADAASINRLNTFTNVANTNVVGLVAKGVVEGITRGFSYLGAGQFQSDRVGEVVTTLALRTGASAGNEITFTVVPFGSQNRIGIDRDQDGFFDRDEVVGCGGDPANPLVTPIFKGDVDENGVRTAADATAFAAVLLDPDSVTDRRRCAADMNSDAIVDGADIAPFISCLLGGPCQ